MKGFLIGLYKKYTHRFVPRWLVLLFDVAVVFFAFYVAFAVRLNFELQEFSLEKETPQAFFVALVYALSFWGLRSFYGIIRHTNLNDAYRIFQATGLSFLFLLAFGSVVRLSDFQVPWSTSFAVYLIHFLLTFFVLMGFRVVVKTVFSKILNMGRQKGHRVIIFGAGTSGMRVRSALENDPSTLYEVVAYADELPGKINKLLEGVPVMHPHHALKPEFVKKVQADLLIIAIHNLHPGRRAEIIEKAMELDMNVRVVPPLDQWLQGELSSGQLKKVRIEDLMERERIVLDSENVAADLRGKVVMITGAAGSIGSEISRQVLRFSPAKVVLVDQAESGLFDLQHEIARNTELKNNAPLAHYTVANINDRLRMEQLFQLHRPSIVYHSAAYKHVPLMEAFPYEALLTNVFGTQILADLSLRFGVEKFVMVSSDKAVNPTNVMGASKRLAEIYIQSLPSQSTQFITTRFGNVLDSSGSVIPLFRKQIEAGGPVTLTHKDITRYFMMISEACHLVLEAGSLGNGGEIFLFEMGEPVKIMELARKMIRLSGLEPGKDILIKEVGLRPGEKLYEELLDTRENTLPTHHPKILHAGVRPNDHHAVCRQMQELAELLNLGDDLKMVAKMKEMVPEYRSENSIYSSLDK